MGINKNSKNILISHDITYEERTIFEGKKEKNNEKQERMNRSVD